MDPWYTTRERVKDALGGADTGANNYRIDRNIDAASRAIEQRLHRVFHPVHATKYFAWPTDFATSYRLWIDHPAQLVELEELSSGDVAFDMSAVFPEPANDGPPYDRLELNQGTNSAFSAGASYQRNIQCVGLWGYRNDETRTTTVTDDTADLVTVASSARVGVGSLIRVGGERMIVLSKLLANTGLTLAVQLNDVASATVLTMSGTTGAPEPGEQILVGGEYMAVLDSTGTSLLVRRAQQSTPLATHVIGAPISAPRQLYVQRASGGTESATHAAGDEVFRWEPPSQVERLAIAETIAMLRSETSGMASSVGTGDSASELSEKGLQRLWRDAYNALGRKARLRGVSGR